MQRKLKCSGCLCLRATVAVVTDVGRFSSVDVEVKCVGKESQRVNELNGHLNFL